MSAIFIFSDLGSTQGVLRATVAFEEVDGQLEVVGKEGNGNINPTLIVRTGYQYQLTVVNNDSEPHSLVIGGLAHTQILEPGQIEVLTFSSSTENIHPYSDGVTDTTFGQVKIVKIEAIFP